VLYADTSAITRAYLADEAEYVQLDALLHAAAQPILTSEIARVEFAGAAVRAARAGRIGSAHVLIRSFDSDCRPDASISLVPLDRDAVMGPAQQLAVAHGLRALDAIHLAVALVEAGRAGSAPFAFLTRDDHQAAAARGEGLRVI